MAQLNLAAPAPTKPPTPRELVLLSALGLVIFLSAWSGIAASGLVSSRFLPSPVAVGETLLRLVRESYAGYTIQVHTLASLKRFMLGFLLAAVVGVPLGLMMGWYRWLDDAVTPLFEAVRFIPPIAWVPFAALWFGTGIGGPILVIFTGAFPPCVVNAYRGAKLVDKVLVEAAQTLGAGSLRVIAEVLVPAALPSIVAGLRVGAGLGWQSLIGAELIVVSSGVGYLMVQGQATLRTAVVMSGMAAIGVIGFLLDVVLRALERRIRHSWGVEP